MPVHRIESTSTHVRLWKDSSIAGRKEVDVVAELTKQGGDNVKVAAFIKAELQAHLDVRQNRSDLPNDDPDKTTNPKRLDLFWDGGNLVGRGVIVTNVVWDGTTYAVSLRRAN